MHLKDEARGYLFAGEEVALIVRPHPIVLLRPMLPSLAAIALFAAFTNRFTFLCLVVVLARFAWDVAHWWVDRYVLTTDRILSMEGLITKKVISMPLGKITDLTYERSIAGRILGYGKLDLESAGQVGLEHIDHLPEPDGFYRAVMSLALGPPASGGDPSDAGAPYEDEDDSPPRGRHMRVDDTDQVPAVRRSDD